MTAENLRIRSAAAGDADAICRIYNQGIQDRVATLETEERTPEERAQWLGARGPRHPVLVAEADGGVVGWASLNVFNNHAVTTVVEQGENTAGEPQLDRWRTPTGFQTPRSVRFMVQYDF